MVICGDNKQRHKFVVMAAVFLGPTVFVLPDKSFEVVPDATMILLTALVLHGSPLGWCVLPILAGDAL